MYLDLPLITDHQKYMWLYLHIFIFATYDMQCVDTEVVQYQHTPYLCVKCFFFV